MLWNRRVINTDRRVHNITEQEGLLCLYSCACTGDEGGRKEARGPYVKGECCEFKGEVRRKTNHSPPS